MGRELLTDFYRNLVIGQLISGFIGKDVSLESFVLDPLFQLAFGLTWAEYLDGVGCANKFYDFIVEFVLIISKSSVPSVFGCDFL